MLNRADESPKMKGRTMQLRLNPQQRELLQRAAVTENLPSIEALVRYAISQSDDAATKEKSSV